MMPKVYNCPVHGWVSYTKVDQNGVRRCYAIRGSAMSLDDCLREVEEIPTDS